MSKNVFTPARRSLEWRSSLGIADDEMAVAYLGRIVMEKGLDVFSDALADIEGAGGDASHILMPSSAWKALAALKTGTGSCLPFMAWRPMSSRRNSRRTRLADELGAELRQATGQVRRDRDNASARTGPLAQLEEDRCGLVLELLHHPVDGHVADVGVLVEPVEDVRQALAQRVVRQSHLAEEIVQDAFVSLHRHWSQLRAPGAAPAWLRTAVVNGSRGRLRRRGVHAPRGDHRSERQPEQP